MDRYCKHIIYTYTYIHMLHIYVYMYVCMYMHLEVEEHTGDQCGNLKLVLLWLLDLLQLIFSVSTQIYKISAAIRKPVSLEG